MYQVGHHGSHNGTTVALLEAMTPEVTVIRMGEWDFGKDPARMFSIYAYGHPRRTIVEWLELAVRWSRPTLTTVKVAERAKSFHDREVRGAVFAKGWDGTVRIEVSSNGTFWFDSD